MRDNPRHLVRQEWGFKQYQVVQGDATTLMLRMRVAEGPDPKAVTEEARSAVKELLDERGLRHVEVADAGAAPEISEGGKYRPVLPLAA